jgi:hypothetical protein
MTETDISSLVFESYAVKDLEETLNEVFCILNMVCASPFEAGCLKL